MLEKVTKLLWAILVGGFEVKEGGGGGQVPHPPSPPKKTPVKG